MSSTAMTMAAEVSAAIASPGTTEIERWVLKWQYAHLLNHGSFVTALIEAAVLADSENLALIGQGWPELAAAIHCWRNVPGFAGLMRDKFPFMD